MQHDPASRRDGADPAVDGPGAGAPDPGERGSTPGGHYENTDHGYGTGIQAGNAGPGEPAFGQRPGEHDAGQRHNDRPDPTPGASKATPQNSAAGNTPASEAERHGAQQDDGSAPGGAGGGPSGGEGVFGSNAPFGGGPDGGPAAGARKPGDGPEAAPKR